MRNNRPDLNGLLIIDKPLGWTSSHVCRFIKRVTRGAKVGHAGTLDPLATGVLIICLGKATKLVDSLMASDKQYAATIDLSRTSPTQDLESATSEVPVANPPSREAVEQVLTAFVGAIMQTPPAHSAVKVDGERAYELARAGKLACATRDEPPPSAPESAEEPSRRLTPRPVLIHSIAITGYRWPILELDIHCGKGTYIRSLARDIGIALKTGGVLTGLVRTRSGGFAIHAARTIESLPAVINPGDLVDAGV